MSKSGLIIVDMVKDFTDPEGMVYYPENRDMLPKIAEVVERCRAYGMTIIFMCHSYRQHKYDKNLMTMRPCCIAGSGGDQLDEQLPVDSRHDYIVHKRRYSAFFMTDVDLILRENKVETLIVVGTKTNNCIRATVTDAQQLDYNVIVLSDCVATDSEVVNQVHLNDIAKYLGKVMTSQELFEMMVGGELA